MPEEVDIAALLRVDPLRWRLLGLVADLGLPDCWIAAGFVRNAVWDALHDRPASRPRGDVDVIWYDGGRTSPAFDKQIELELRQREPGTDWSVKNQARMHVRNGDAPYGSACDAMRFWPETATAIAARRKPDGSCDIAAPLGLEDLLGCRLRPTPHFETDRFGVFQSRIAAKSWLIRYPKLVLCGF